MLEKKFTPKRTVCKVIFSVPSEIVNEGVALAGDFSNWETKELIFDEKKQVYKTEVRLQPESEYRFKYLIDGEKWENDYVADAYVPNEFGTEDSLVSIGK